MGEHSMCHIHLPGDIVRRASRDAGFNGVAAVHTHCVKGLVITVPKGIKVDISLGSCLRPRLTWRLTKNEKRTSLVTNNISYFSYSFMQICVVPVCVISSGTTLCPDRFKFGSQCPATVKHTLTHSVKNISTP